MIKRLGLTIHLSIVALVIALALVYSDNTHAHTIRVTACDRWELAREKQSCLAYIRVHKIAHACQRPVRPLIGTRVTVKHHRASLHQRKVLTAALNTARQRRLIRYKTYVALVAAIAQESTAHNLPHGHSSSIGILQLIDLHGSVAWRMHIPNSVNWFLNGVIPDDRAHPNLRVTDLVQRQQRSAYPSAYAQWVREAQRTVRLFLGPCAR